MYQIFMRPGTTEYAIMILFELGLVPKISLGHPDRLANPNFPIPVSFIYGDRDWVVLVDRNGGKNVVEVNPHESSRYHVIQNSDHNMHMDNPLGFANTIINDIF